jgi:hypothetical protein
MQKGLKNGGCATDFQSAVSQNCILHTAAKPQRHLQQRILCRLQIVDTAD